jgi:hypothetical protein
MEWVVIALGLAIAFLFVAWGLDRHTQIRRRRELNVLLDDQVRQATSLAEGLCKAQCEVRRLRISAQNARQRADLAEEVRSEAVAEKDNEQARGDDARENLAEIDQLAERIRELTGGGNDQWQRPIVVGGPDDAIVLEAAFLGPGYVAMYARVLSRMVPTAIEAAGVNVCGPAIGFRQGDLILTKLERHVHERHFDGYYGIVEEGQVEEIAERVREFNMSFRETEVSNVGAITEEKRTDRDRAGCVGHGCGGSRQARPAGH